ncbi:MAG TPA: tRNA pseudouridine(55) synthase TruB [Bacilli bacterium]|nr:tRNA pseudouridine(55) synthase TruB [Bacilli bacterium]
MNGLLIVNKPQGITSRDVVNQICQIYGTKKVGHTGTLDPLASGVLVLCLGKATKLVDIITAESKTYLATIKWGILTDTLDITGNILKEESKVQDQTLINNTILSFIGEYEQEVPLYSAVKVNGRRLYDYARHQQKPELPKKLVKIFDMQITNNTQETVTFKATVAKGTYIRSLIRDICQKLDTIGTMQELVRLEQGSFTIEEAVNLDQITAQTPLIPIKRALSNYEQVIIDEELYFKIKNGGKVANFFNDQKAVIIYQNEVIAIYQKDQHDSNLVRPYKMLI